MNYVKKKIMKYVVITTVFIVVLVFVSFQIDSYNKKSALFNEVKASNSMPSENGSSKSEYKSLIDSTLNEQSELYLYERSFSLIHSEDNNMIENPKNFITKPFAKITDREFEVELELTFKHGVDISKANVYEDVDKVYVEFDNESELTLVIPDISGGAFKTTRGVMRNVFTEEERSIVVSNAIHKANQDIEDYKDYDELNKNLDKTIRMLLNPLIADKELIVEFKQKK